MITQAQFVAEIERLVLEFPGLAYSPVKTAMIWNRAKVLPRESLEKVVNHLIASARRPPTVQDVLDGLASDLRVYGGSSASSEEYKPTCFYCKDVGVLMAKGHELDTLCNCSCKIGLRQTWALPNRADLPGDMVYNELPWEPFKPEFTRFNDPSDPKNLVWAIDQKVRWWRETVRIHEESWAEHSAKLRNE